MVYKDLQFVAYFHDTVLLMRGGQMKKLFVIIFLAFLPLSGCGDGTTATRTNDFTPLTSIQILSANPQIANQTSNQFQAIGNFSGLFTRDITGDVLWQSSDVAVATISNTAGSPGLAKGLAPGTITITASLNGVSGDFDLTVSNAGITSIALSPLTPSIPKGLTQQFQAVGTFTDPVTFATSTQDITLDVTWSSLDPAIVTVSDATGNKGLASAVDIGTTTVSADFNTVTGSTVMTVVAPQLQSISLTPTNVAVLTLDDLQFSAQGSYSDATTVDITNLVSWSSSFPTLASVSNLAGTEGLVTGLLEGSTQISASLDGVSSSTPLQVTGGNLSAITVTPGNSLQLVLTPNPLPVQMRAEGSFGSVTRDITDKVTWTSTNTSVGAPVAPINTSGVVTPVGAGSATITAEYGTIAGSTTLGTVSGIFNAGSLVISPATIDTPLATPGTSLNFSAEGTFFDGGGNRTVDLTSQVLWSTTDAGVATISNDPSDIGRAVGVTAGTVDVSADFRGEVSPLTTLTVNNPVLQSFTIDTPGGTLLAGEVLQLRATASYATAPLSVDITDDVTWSTSNSFIARFHDPVNAPGELVGTSTGQAVITASFGGQIQTVTYDVP